MGSMFQHVLPMLLIHLDVHVRACSDVGLPDVDPWFQSCATFGARRRWFVELPARQLRTRAVPLAQKGLQAACFVERNSFGLQLLCSLPAERIYHVQHARARSKK